MKEYFGYSLYSFYDMEKDLVDSEVDIMQWLICWNFQLCKVLCYGCDHDLDLMIVLMILILWLCSWSWSYGCDLLMILILWLWSDHDLDPGSQLQGATRATWQRSHRVLVWRPPSHRSCSQERVLEKDIPLQKNINKTSLRKHLTATFFPLQLLQRTILRERYSSRNISVQTWLHHPR